MLTIRFTKGTDDKPDHLTCVRADGSSTWMRSSDFFVRHDIIHYATESILGCREAFYGLLASGWNIEDFGELDPATGKKREIPAEAGEIEFLVGILQLELISNQPEEELRSAMESAYSNAGMQMPALSDEQIAAIRRRVRELYAQWDALPPGGVLEVTFDPQSLPMTRQNASL
jgi:hypothetical protein